jgi:TATA-box binding protein (TBP) (component of TFIID and TFIIIB)
MHLQHYQIPANEIVIGLETPLYTTFILSAEIVELGLGTTTYLPENFNGIVFHLQNVN